jgi:hypothetical protein
MECLGWAFWALNGIVAIHAVYHWSRLWNANSVWGLTTPAGWIWIWQVAGVGLVPLLGWSPWHLFWCSRWGVSSASSLESFRRWRCRSGRAKQT